MTSFSTTRRQALHRLAATALTGLALAGCTGPGPGFHAIDITGADYAKDFSLPDAQGRVRTLADFKGKVVVLFFGYAQCPDVCPTTMSRMVEIKQQLGGDGERLQVVFVTVDPERDTAEVMKAYTEAFDPSFVALIPTIEQLPELAKNFKVYYKKVEGQTPTSYSMEHSAGSLIYDPRGRLRLYAKYGMPVAGMVADVKALL
jgi:protein SCO1/2